MDIFLSAPGRAVAIDLPGIPMSLTLEGWGGYSFFKSIITGFEVQTKSGVQYLHTLRDMIYVYVFGERVTPIGISGLSFAAACEWIQDSEGLPNHGLEYSYAYYLANRVSSRASPVSMVLGLSTPFFGFLDGARFSLADTERLLGQFSFNFTGIPEPSPLTP
jgi:hypothetical protein